MKGTGLFLTAILVVCTGSLFAQKEANNWFFGWYGGMTWNTTQTIGGLSGLPTPLAGGQVGSAGGGNSEGCFSMSDADGNLLFYSEGMTIWNKNHAVMTNGNGLTGGASSTQSGIVTYYPGQPNQYVVFSITQAGGTNQLAYSVIDMTQNGGLGAVTTKNVPLTGASGTLMEQVIAVKISDDSGYWIISPGHGNPAYLNVWKLTGAGMQTACIASYQLPYLLGTSSVNGVGYLRFSTDGKRFAMATLSDGRLFFGEFDPETGVLTNIKTLTDYSNFGAYGVEFSPSGKILYVSHMMSPTIPRIYVYQFEDLLAGSATESQSAVNQRVFQGVQPGGSNYSGALSLGPDGRIYGAINASNQLSVLDNIEDYAGVTYHQLSGLMAGTHNLGLPNFIGEWFESLLIEANPDTVSTISCLPVTVDVLANDSLGYCSAAGLVVPEIVSQPANGFAEAIGNKIVYTPNSGFVGEDCFPYHFICMDDTAVSHVCVNVVYDHSCSPVAADDYLQVLTCHLPTVPTVLDVLLNDTMIHCPRSAITLTLTNGPQVPGASATVNANKDIEYTRAAGFIGRDTLEYQALCNGTAYAATVFITVAECPDNISEEDCTVEPVSTVWGIKVAQSTPLEVSALLIPLVGDLNDDGTPEIVCFGSAGVVSLTSLLGSGYGSARGANNLLIYDGATLNKIRTIVLPSYVPAYDAAAYGLVKLPNRTGLIVVATIDYKLRAYDYDGNLVWTSRVGEDYGAGTLANAQFSVNIGFADFNGDGYPEIYIRDKIYDAETGYLLGVASGGSNTGSAWGHTTDTPGWMLSSPIAADVLGDGTLQLILGNEIYSVTITNRNSTSNPIVLAKSIAPPAGAPEDGHAQVADFDNDGHLDILITNRTSVAAPGTVYAYVWDVYHNTVSNPLAITMENQGKSIPLIGDVNNDGNLDIVIQCNISGDPEKFRAYGYNPSTQNFSFLWGDAPDENSWSNGCTMFDFNLDGTNEVLISDQAAVRILNGTTGATISSFNYGQTTVMQYPVIADVDGDGSAEIIAVGITDGGASSITGSLNVFKSSGTPWAPARKVWNQYMYNVVNINEDLTVPRYQMNPATLFPSEKRPYNNFLVQQTTLNKDGEAFMLAPDLIWDPAFSPPASYTYYSNGDSLTITVHVKNQGDAAIGSPVYFTAYKDAIPGGKMGTGAYPAQIFPDSTATFSFCIEDFMSQYSPLSQIIIRLNDNDGDFPYQQECDYSDSIIVLNNIIAAKRDFAITPINQPVTIPVLNNDLLGSCNSSTIALSIATAPHSGAASTGAGNTIICTPNNEFQGLDSLEYTINCSGSTSTARVYIYVYPNTSQFCAGSSTTVNIGLNSGGVSVVWYNSGVYVPSINVSGLSGSIDYPYEVRVTFPVYLGSELVTDASAIYHVKVTPLLMYWKKTATNSNWNDPSNWVTASDAALNAVPQSCTTVHIPGNAGYYPSLDVDNTLRTPYYGEPECDSIFFHFGGEVAKPHLLDYNKALIEYNFGYYSGSTYQTGGDNHSALPPMERGKWYALATPLNRITPGDFSFGGKPDAWQQAFIRNNISGMFTGAWQDPDNANATDVPEEQYGGIAVWMADIVPGSIGEDASYHTNLNDLKGILRMPYFEDSYLSGKHRIHDYISGMSRFYYYYYKNPSQDIAWTIYDDIVRGSESYRFVFDGKLPLTYISSAGDNFPTFKMAVPAGKELMIGNPFLSNLDFDEFYAINAGSLENDTYRLYVDGGWGYHYSADGGSWPLTQYIAPLQAFFIQTSAGATELLFPPDLVSVTVPTNKLRAAGNRYSNVLYVEASNGEGSSWATLGMKTGTNVDYLFNNDTLYLNVPQIYALDGNHKNAVQFISGETEIPLGIRSQSAGMITLRFMNVERFYVESLTLEDKVSGDRYDLLRGTNEIEFSNLPDSPDRFLLKVGKQTVGTGVANKDSGVLVRTDRNKLFVASSEIIRQIVVMNMQGIQLLNRPFASTSVTIDLNVPSGIYIVKVMLGNGESGIEKLRIKN